MADYKDIIAGTLSNIMGKVKDVAESGAVKDIYEHGASRAKSYGRIAKLTFEMNGDSEELKRIYAEIGRLYYEQAKGSAEGVFAPLFAQADEVTQRIIEAEQEIQAMKAEYESEGVKNVEVEVCEFEDVVDATESDGSDACPKE